MQNGIHLADIGKELVAKTLAAARAADKTGNVHKFHHRRGDLLGIVHLRKAVKPCIGHGHDTHVGADGAEGIVCRIRAGIGQSIEKSGFSDVGKSHDTKFHKSVSSQFPNI